VTDRDSKPPTQVDDPRDGESRNASHKLEGDERMYTGEPVDTGDSTLRPQQMNVGFENMEGSGEWPDPRTPPKPGSVGEADGGARETDDR
jgi:hypothetical protein